MNTGSLTNAHTITEPSFHPCVRVVPVKLRKLRTFVDLETVADLRNRTLSFVPPNGLFTPMDYHFDPCFDPSAARKPGAAPALPQVQVPFVLRSTLSVSVHLSLRQILTKSKPGTFELTVSTSALNYIIKPTVASTCQYHYP